MTNIVTLTTDFGLADEYVGILKGVILSKAPKCRLVDLGHAVPAYDIRMAAYMIYSAYPFFAPGTIHLIVVDPGVGSSRDIIAIEAHKQFFMAPDNGVLSMFIKNCAELTAHKITNQDIFLKPFSSTFHGRDIFAPAAAHMANGSPISSLGPQVPPQKLKLLELPTIKIDQKSGQIQGYIIHIDHFGNLMTNISKDALAELHDKNTNPEFCLTVNQHTISPLCPSYQTAPPGDPLIILNSRNLLEIAINSGNAAQQLQVNLNTPVTLVKI